MEEIINVPVDRKDGLIKAFRDTKDKHSTVVLIYQDYIILDHLLGEAVTDSHKINIVTGEVVKICKKEL